MNLYLLSQDTNNKNHTYDSCIVAAETKEEARVIHPSNYYIYRDWLLFSLTDFGEEFEVIDYSWVNSNKVKVQLIGKATEGTKKWVILASFNAG